MARKNGPGYSRPKTVPSGLRTLFSMRISPKFDAWLDELTDATGSASRSDTIRWALKTFAESEGFTKPMPKR